MDLGLTDKVFVVTAASSGLGLASAQALHAEGAKVVLVARRQEVLDELAGSLDAAVVAGDLADPATITRAFDLAMERHGRVDGAVVSVGGPPRGGVLDISDEQWNAAFSSVFLPALRAARELYSHNPAGRLALVLSTSSRVPLPQMAPSNGLRPGLAMLISQLADEVGPNGGRVMGLMPGNIATDRMTWLLSQAPDPAAAKRAAESSIPLGRMGDPAEFGRVAAFVVSDAGSYLSGSLVAVDGGQMRTF